MSLDKPLPGTESDDEQDGNKDNARKRHTGSHPGRQTL